MSTISRTYQFTDGTTAYGSQVESEISNIVTTWNNHDAGTSNWTVVNISSSNTTPLSVISSGATTIVSIDNTATDGDPQIRFKLSATSIIAMGIDDSDSDKFKVGTTDITTATSMVITTAGEITKPLQPAFLATSAGANDVTGDGTVYTIVWDTEIYDQNADFASNTFTAPVTGRYLLTASINLKQIGAGHTNIALTIVTGNRSYNRGQVQGAGLYTSFTMTNTVIADMDAGDTATVTVTVSGSTKTVDVDSDVTTNVFSGCLLA